MFLPDFIIDGLIFYMMIDNNKSESIFKFFRFSRRESIIVMAFSIITIAGSVLMYANDNHFFLEPTDVISQINSKNITYRIDINSAEWQELRLLPGIGEAKAKLIIEYRNRKGYIQSVEELSKCAWNR